MVRAEIERPARPEHTLGFLFMAYVKKRRKKYPSKFGEKPAFVTPSDLAKSYTYGQMARAIAKERRKFFGQYLSGKLEEHLPMALKGHSKLMADAVETVVADKAFGVIEHFAGSPTNSSSNKFGFGKAESIPSETDFGEIALAGLNKITTKFVTGRQSTKSVIRVAENYGTTSYNLFDTTTDLKENRQSLSIKFGFNQKRYVFLSELFTTCVKDHIDLLGLTDKSNPFVTSMYSDNVAYGLVKHEHMRFKLANANKYLPTKMRIHLVEMLDGEIDMGMLFNYTFQDDVTKPDKTSGKIPVKYQIQNKVVDKSADVIYHHSVLCTRLSRLNMSAAFNQNARVVKTFTHKVEAGQIWEFDLTVLLGPGIRLDQLFYDNYVMGARNGSQPSTYGIVLEFCGYDCVGVEKHAGNKQDYQGTSRGLVSMELSKSIEVVNSDVVMTTQGFESSKVALKLHRKDVSTGIVFNKNYDDISDIETDKNSFYIPVRTDMTIKDQGDA